MVVSVVDGIAAGVVCMYTVFSRNYFCVNVLYGRYLDRELRKPSLRFFEACKNIGTNYLEFHSLNPRIQITPAPLFFCFFFTVSRELVQNMISAEVTAFK